MSVISASITVLKSDPKFNKKTHPSFNQHWFGSSANNSSISLDGNRVIEVIVCPETTVSEITPEQLKNNQTMKGLDTSFGAVRYNSVYVSFATFKEASKAFKKHAWLLEEGVVLGLGSFLSVKPTEFKDIKPS
jgi:hypothetical protein